MGLIFLAAIMSIAFVYFAFLSADPGGPLSARRLLTINERMPFKERLLDVPDPFMPV